jgi:hypothetical protein
MKITQSRLLQIIREEVERHEKNTFTLDENFFQEEELTKKEKTDAIESEIAADEEAGNLDEIGLELDREVEEDRLFTKQRPRKIIQPKNKNDI